MKTTRKTLYVIPLSFLISASSLFAQATWSGSDAGNWNVSGNWSGIAPLDNGTSALIFSSPTTPLSSVNGLSGLNVSALSFNAGTGANTITGNGINLTGAVTDNATTAQALNLNINLGTAARTFAIASGGSLSLGGTLSGASTITKTTAGSLTLSNSNTLTGSANDTVNSTITGAGTYKQALLFSGATSGTVVLKNTAALGAATNSVRFSGSGSGVLDLQTDTSVNAYSIFSGSNHGGTINVGRATSGAGIIHNLGVLDLSSVTMTVNTGSNVSSGTAGVSFTSLSLSGGNDNAPVTLAGSAAINIGTAGITNNTGTTRRLQLDGTNSANTIGAINDLAPGATANIGKINLIKANTSTWTLTGTNGYTGTTTINGGTLKAGSTTALSSASAFTLANTVGVTLDLNGFSNSIGSLSGGGTTGGNVSLGSGTLTVGADNTSPAAYGGVITGTGGLIKNGTGTLILSNLNTYTGDTTVNAGTLTLSNGGSTGVIRGMLTVNSGGTINSTAGDSFGYNNNTKVNTLNIVGGTVTHNSGSNLTLSSVTVNMTGGVMQATGTGGFDLYNNGGSNTAINTLGSSNTATIAGKLNLRAGNNNATGTVFTVADGAAADDLVVSAIMADGFAEGTLSAIQKSGAGVMVLSGQNTYTGATTINAGTLKAGSTTALSSASTFTLANTAGATLDLNGLSNSIGSLSGGGTTGGNVSLGSGTLTVGANNTSPAAYGGVISGTGGLIKTGTGALTLSNQNTYTGDTTVNAGTLTLSNGGATGVIRGMLTVNSGGTLNSTAGDSFGYNDNTKVNTLNIVGGTVTHNSGSNLTLSSATVNMTGGLMQTTGTGGFDLYNNGGGNTAINTLGSSNTATIAGKLNLRAGNNNATGTVFTVADGAAANDLVVSAIMADGFAEGTLSAIQKSGAGVMVLSGQNTYTGATTINEGTLKMGVANAISASSAIKLAGGTLDASTFSATLGTLSLTGSSTITLGSGGTFAFADSSALNWGTNNTLSITGSFLDGASIRFGISDKGLTSAQLALITINGLAAAINSGGFLTSSAIPEPSTYAALAGLGVLILATYRRRPTLHA